MRHWYFPLILLITCFEREGEGEGNMEIFLWNYRSGGGVSVLLVGINCLHTELWWALDVMSRDEKPSLFIYLFICYEISYIETSSLGMDKFDFLRRWNCFSLSAIKLHGRRGAEPLWGSQTQLTEVTGNCLNLRSADWSLLVDPSSYHPSSYFAATSIGCSEIQ